MIDKYKRKLVLISVTVMFIVLSSIVVGTNIANAITVRQNADIVVDILLQNNGEFPDFGKQGIVIGENEYGDIYLNPEIPFSARYFTISVDNNGNIINLNCDKVTIDESLAKEKYQAVKGKNDTHGFIENYRYGFTTKEDLTFYVFLDKTEEVQNNKLFLFYSIMFLIFGTVLVLILIVIFTDVILTPVEASYLKQKQFITDAGHELKTPLAVISANTELIEMEMGENEYTSEIKEQVSNLNELTKNLILLSKLDEGTYNKNFTQFNLSECVFDSAKKMTALCQTKGKKFNLQIDENVHFIGSEENIKRMILLLLDNAIKYSKSEEITLKMTKESKKVVISTINKCDFKQGNYNQLFERFYRHDKSRNKQTGGSGIGLSVVNSIANMHDGSVSAICDENGFLTIKIILNSIKNTN
ncbi:MAG: HAMP domain-containing histidine kinase [Clostridia bacterium]|nr:HAMP domain-containing histidine kinase [Clostridia bacterium]